MLLSPLDVQDSAEWKTMFDVNVMGLMNGMQAVLTPMKTVKPAPLSISARLLAESHLPIMQRTAALSLLFMPSPEMREESAGADFNVRVTTIAPGAVETELLSHTTSSDIIDGYEDLERVNGRSTFPGRCCPLC